MPPAARCSRRTTPGTSASTSCRVASELGRDRALDRLGRSVHADFGSGLYDGAPDRHPVHRPSRSASRRCTCASTTRTSPTGARTRSRANAPIEGGRGSDGDRHVIVVDRDALPALRAVRRLPADGGKRWQRRLGRDLEPALEPAAPARLDLGRRRRAADPARPRPLRGGRSAAASTTRCASPRSARARRSSIPARHFASSLDRPDLPAMGQRLRLKASFDVSRFPRQARVVLTALKRYGMILADNGSSWYVSGAPTSGWNNDDLHPLSACTGCDFEVVDTGSFRRRRARRSSGRRPRSGRRCTMSARRPPRLTRPFSTPGSVSPSRWLHGSHSRCPTHSTSPDHEAPPDEVVEGDPAGHDVAAGLAGRELDPGLARERPRSPPPRSASGPGRPSALLEKVPSPAK